MFALASAHHGVVSTAQLSALGLSRQAITGWVRRRRLKRLHVGVYAVGHEALTHRGRALAAVLACGPDALLSYRSAADLWGLLPTSSPRIEVTARRSRKPRAGMLVHRSRVVHPEDAAELYATPVTSVARTIVDLADVVGTERLARAVRQAEILRLLDLAAISRVVERLPGRRGRGRLARVLAAYTPDAAFTRSGDERRFLRMCDEHGLPRPQANLWIHEQEVDFYWPDARLAIELDGGPWHQTVSAFQDDRGRDRALARRGIQVNRVTAEDLKRPAALAHELREIRAARLRR